MRVLLCGLLMGLCASPAGAWTKPKVVVKGDDAGLLSSVIKPDGTPRAAISDERRKIGLGLVDLPALRDPLVVLRSPALVAQVALASDGSGVALEVARKGPSSVVAFDAAGAPQPPVTLNDVGDGPAIAISPAGAAVAAWVAKGAQGFEVLAAFRDPGATTFGAPVRAGYTTTEHTLVTAGIGDRGEAVVAWQVNGFPSDLAAAVRLPGAGFSKARFVVRRAGWARLAVGPGGQAILAADRGAGLDVSVKPPGADAMPAAKRIDHGQGYAVAVAAAGPRRVAAAWEAAPRLRAHARVRVYDGARRIGTVGRDASGEELGLAVDGAGTAVIAWEEAVRRGTKLGVAYRPAGARFRSPQYFGPVAVDETPESVQLGAGGRAWVLYEEFGPGRRVYVTERKP
jgi:hypothetical protein